MGFSHGGGVINSVADEEHVFTVFAEAFEVIGFIERGEACVDGSWELVCGGSFGAVSGEDVAGVAGIL